MLEQKLTDLELTKEAGEYYLKAEFLTENNVGFYKRTVPRIRLPIKLKDQCISINREYNSQCLCYENTINIGFGPVPVEYHEGRLFVDELIESKVHKMTIEEIEKKLGYKVEIVSGK